MRIIQPDAELRNILASKNDLETAWQACASPQVRSLAFQRVNFRRLIICQQPTWLDAERRRDNW